MKITLVKVYYMPVLKLGGVLSTDTECAFAGREYFPLTSESHAEPPTT